MSDSLPVEYLRKTDTLVAFRHPRPSYPVHILLVPKRAIARLEDITPADADFLSDLYACVQSLVEELELSAPGYRLVVNGGSAQDVPQLHFHLISEG